MTSPGRPGNLHPTPERVRLANGLTAVLQPHDAAEVAAVQLWVRAGARDERPDEAGLSHFIEHLLFKGTPTRGPGVIDETISGLGGEMNAATSQDWTYFHVVLPATRLDTALDILADAAQHAAFDPVEVERERHVVLEEIRRAEDTPSAALWRVLSRGHFGEHAYGRPVLGTAASIAGVPHETILDYFRRSYVPNNSTVVVAGSMPVAESLDAVTRAFGGWAPSPLPARPRRSPAPPGAPRRLQRVEGAPPDVPRHGVGRGHSARPRRLRARPRDDRAGAGTVVAADAVAPGAARARVGDRQELLPPARLGNRRGDRSDDDGPVCGDRGGSPGGGRAPLGGARQRGGVCPGAHAVEAEHAFSGETAEGSAYTLGTADTVWTLEFELGYVDAVRRVTREDMRDAARRHLRADRFTGAVIGPEAAGGGE